MSRKLGRKEGPRSLEIKHRSFCAGCPAPADEYRLLHNVPLRASNKMEDGPRVLRRCNLDWLRSLPARKHWRKAMSPARNGLQYNVFPAWQSFRTHDCIFSQVKTLPPKSLFSVLKFCVDFTISAFLCISNIAIIYISVHPSPWNFIVLVFLERALNTQDKELRRVVWPLGFVMFPTTPVHSNSSFPFVTYTARLLRGEDLLSSSGLHKLLTGSASKPSTTETRARILNGCMTLRPAISPSSLSCQTLVRFYRDWIHQHWLFYDEKKWVIAQDNRQ